MIQYGSHKLLALAFCITFQNDTNKFTENKFAQQLPWPQYEVHKLPKPSLITNEDILMDIIYESLSLPQDKEN